MSQLRKEERYAMEALALAYSGSWRPGDNPPDAVLTTCELEIPVEVSRLSQQTGSGAAMRSRRQDEVPTYQLATDLDAELGDIIPYGTSIGMVLSSPILELRATKAELSRTIRRRLGEPGAFAKDEKFAINGNQITLFRNVHGDAYPKVSAAFMSRDTTADVLASAWMTLEERIRARPRNAKGSVDRGPWLALLNEYEFTEPSRLPHGIWPYGDRASLQQKSSYR